jgi:hypothetical protein
MIVWLLCLLPLKNLFQYLNIIPNSKTFSNKLSNELIIDEANWKTNGFDQRTDNKNIKDRDEIKIMQIKKYFAIKKSIDFLKDDNIPLYMKIVLLNDFSIRPYNIFAGGLLDDFDSKDF